MKEQLTKNFYRHEFECNKEECGCGLDKISLKVLTIFQEVRDHFGKPVRCTSGCRCETHNRNVGGVYNSQHTLQEDDLTHAGDMQVQDVSPKEVYDFLNNKYPDSLGIGLYNTFVHVDDRSERAFRWGRGR